MTNNVTAPQRRREQRQDAGRGDMLLAKLRVNAQSTPQSHSGTHRRVLYRPLLRTTGTHTIVNVILCLGREVPALLRCDAPCITIHTPASLQRRVALLAKPQGGLDIGGMLGEA
ncbi:hypothetical protein TraAM80_02515 [Trypanosoma rangeli]|uniref:Uncharacterized protein n=1 Tax=Trypanosoma rangeli TaxID=5698 RepID=A0A3R7NNQ7_TRYRA|nr:uncharacterized protein TraAM80_02515 [Trypanosoma rangeli]RNF09083.1 hypothetical protein TraAM80_02515 [Trypanosoma rangeli]|eukprot:RNF09083.1 hypothetical protein TraAM80_02515 [Trypanosoma rangeli]